MKLDIRATAPINARNDTIRLGFEAAEVIGVEMPVPSATPVTWVEINAAEVELADCNAFRCTLRLAPGQGPKLRLRVRTGPGCDVELELDGQDFAHVGPNADQTFIQNC